MVRTRFAPSPTGILHIGNVRTALFAWLYARKHGGQFILRIEDTDCERSSTASLQNILSELAWLGLDYDEGPFYQSQRSSYYEAALQQLLADGKAYYCYCTKQEIDARLAARNSAKKDVARGYDGYCRERVAPRAGVTPVVRLRTPDSGTTCYQDCVLGQVATMNSELSDIIIVRANKMPTYNFAVVVDDIAMKISHVIRGNDHINNTFQQINIIKSLGGEVPQYAHLPMVIGSDGQRLSKRDQVAGIAGYREQGYLPHALLNYLVRLGWAKGDQEIFTLDEMIAYFDLDDINKSAAAFNAEKLQWLNGHYLAELPIAELNKLTTEKLLARGLDLSQGPPLAEVLGEMRLRHKTLNALAEGLVFLYRDTIEYDPQCIAAYQVAQTVELMQLLIPRLSALEDWQSDRLKSLLSEFSSGHGVKMGAVAKPLRFILSGNLPSPALALVMQWLGKQRCLLRLKDFLSQV